MHLATRLVQAVTVALLVGAATFAMMRSLPGDAAWRIAAGRYGYDNVNAAAADAVRAELGLGGPLVPGASCNGWAICCASISACRWCPASR
jgi:peptide/nickel transport system permease protein